MPYGTLEILDTLAAQRTLIADYGEDDAFGAIAQYMAAWNRIVDEMFMELCEPTTDRLRRYGGVASITMIRGDEFSRPEAQKATAGVNIGIPLEMYQTGLQWTRKYFQTHTIAELQGQVNAVRTADEVRIVTEIQRALFTPTNNTSYVDHLVDNSSSITLPIRALLNADSTAIPADPWGNTFTASTHTHYIGTGSFVVGDLTSLITLVQEHYNQGGIRVYINQAQEAAVRAFAGFQPLYDGRLTLANTVTFVTGSLDIMNVYNRQIGILGAAEIFVKPWVPSGYVFAFNPAQRKPLALRTRPGVPSGLQLVADNEQYPLRAQTFEREFGVAVQERANGAILYTGNATYAAPTLAA
jgi:hypothetical protein